jgi:hypothetical protein
MAKSYYKQSWIAAQIGGGAVDPRGDRDKKSCICATGKWV